MRVVPPARSEPTQSVAALSAGLTALAEKLYQLDTLPELALAKEPDRLRGKSAAVANAAATTTASLWERYPVLQEAVEALQTASVAGDRPEVDRLLGPKALVLPGGSKTGASALLKALEADLKNARAAADKLAAAWRAVVPRLDAASATLRTTAAQASDLGLDEPEIEAAQGLVQELSALAAVDPLTVDPEPAERAVARARERVDALAARRSTLTADLRAAAATLAQLERLIRDGHDAHALAAARIAAPAGLAAPLAAGVLEEGGQALRPWLDRVEAQAGAGSWVAAVTGLGQWQDAASRLQRQAEAVVAANRAPVMRRNDLRGLLEAYRAKAAVSGHAEEPSLTRLYGLARDTLYVGPCDVDAAEDRVQEYLAAVNRTGSVR
ncbi:MAG: hypothetical protein ACRD2W_10340 [Acidimicrobiales bacterium]